MKCRDSLNLIKPSKGESEHDEKPQVRVKGPLVKFRFTYFHALPVVGAPRYLAIQVSGALRPLAPPGDRSGRSGGKGLQVQDLGCGKSPPGGGNPRPHTCKPSEGRRGGARTEWLVF